MTNILFPAGSTCEIYSHSWESAGCTDERGVTRGYTQDWYFDANLSSWVSVTENVEIPSGSTGDVVSVDADGFTASSVLNVSNENSRVHLTGHLTNSVFTTTITSTSGTHDLSFKSSGVHKAIFDKTVIFNGTTNLRFKDAPPPGVYGELKLIMENSSEGGKELGTLTLLGISGDSGTGNIKLDSELNLSGTTHDKLYSFKVWTIDNGQNYFVSNDAGSTFGWDIS